MMAELFSQGPRPAATSIAGAANWFSSFIVAVTFPSIQVRFFNNYVIHILLKVSSKGFCDISIVEYLLVKLIDNL